MDPVSVTLKPPVQQYRGHHHRRSAAISGDFDVNLDFLQQPLSTPAPNINLSRSLPCSPMKLTNVGNSITSSPQVKLFITDETTYIDDNTSNSNSNSTGNKVPDALIDLGLIYKASTSTTGSVAGGAELRASPRHSLLCSPQKKENIIAEEDDSDISDSEFESNNTTVNTLPQASSPVLPAALQGSTGANGADLESLLMSKHSNHSLLSNDNLSTHSSSNTNSNHPFSSHNTPSMSSLKGKARYQSYYKLAPPSTPKQSYNNIYSTGSPRVIKSPFQYQSKQYDLPDDFHLQHNLHSSTPSPTSSIKREVPISKAGKQAPKDLEEEPHNSHNRTGSIFSLLSKKITHHKRRSSLRSNYSKSHHHRNSSIIERTTSDELLSPKNEDVTFSEDITFTQDTLGEPGPMIEISENTNVSKTPLGVVTNKKNNNNKKNKGLFNWIVKSKK